MYVTATATDAARAQEMVQALMHSPLVPAAIEVDGTTVTTLLEGVPEAVRLRAETARELIGGEVADDPPGWWGRLPSGDVLAEVRAKPTKLRALLAEEPSHLRGCAGRGIWHAAFPADGAAETLARLRGHGDVVVLDAPEDSALDRWGPLPALPLMRHVKDQFDPGHRLSPGRFAGGI